MFHHHCTCRNWWAIKAYVLTTSCCLTSFGMTRHGYDTPNTLMHNVTTVVAFPLHYQCLDFVLHQSAHDTQSILKLQCTYIGNWSLTVVSTGVTLVVGMCLGLGFEACSTTQPCEPKVTMTAAQPRFSSSRPARPASSTDATQAPVSSSAWGRKQCCVSQNVCGKTRQLFI